MTTRSPWQHQRVPFVITRPRCASGRSFSTAGRPQRGLHRASVQRQPVRNQRARRGKTRLLGLQPEQQREADSRSGAAALGFTTAPLRREALRRTVQPTRDSIPKSVLLHRRLHGTCGARSELAASQLAGRRHLKSTWSVCVKRPFAWAGWGTAATRSAGGLLSSHTAGRNTSCRSFHQGSSSVRRRTLLKSRRICTCGESCHRSNGRRYCDRGCSFPNSTRHTLEVSAASAVLRSCLS